MENIYLILTFDSTNQAMKAEAFLRKRGLSLKVIPTPRVITLSCGLSIRIEGLSIEELKALIEQGLVIKALYEQKNHDIRLVKEDVWRI